MPLVTELTKALGIAKPIIQGGMHHVGFAPLVAAVSNAGGLGLITVLSQPTPEALREEIQKTKALTSKPFVSLTILVCFPYADRGLTLIFPLLATLLTLNTRCFRV